MKKENKKKHHLTIDRWSFLCYTPLCIKNEHRSFFDKKSQYEDVRRFRSWRLILVNGLPDTEF